VRLRENENGLSVGEKERVLDAAGEELDLGIRLPLVSLKVQGQVTKGCHHSSFDLVPLRAGTLQHP
jgi:hypothetical protein